MNGGRATRAQIRRALDILHHGARARVPKHRRRAANDAHHEARPWLHEHTIRGFGIGPREFGAATGELCLRVYVVDKGRDVPDPVPRELTLPGLPPIPTDVVEIHGVSLDAAPPAVIWPGDSIAPNLPGDAHGTFGCLVRKRYGPRDLYLLTNAHVIAQDGLLPSGVGVLAAGQRIATLTDTWKPTFSAYFDNLFDAAIARIESSERVGALLDGRVQIAGIAGRVNRTATVRKFGAQSGAQTGFVTDADFEVWLPYRFRIDSNERQRAGFREQLLCNLQRDEGDSGAIVVNRSNEVVGLHFGSLGGRMSIVSPIRPILDRFDVELVTRLRDPARVGSVDVRRAPSPPPLTERRDAAAQASAAIRPLLRVLEQPRHFGTSVQWRLTPEGLEVAGDVVGSPGRMVTIPLVWERFARPIRKWANELSVPAELIMATIATESLGDPRAEREEDGFVDDTETPQRVSVGLMQTLISTAARVLPAEPVDRAWLLVADNSVRAGAAYIAHQRDVTLFDPPLVAAAYNAGRLPNQPSTSNRWGTIHTIGHVDRFVGFFNDAFRLFRSDASSPAMSFFQQLHAVS